MNLVQVISLRWHFANYMQYRFVRGQGASQILAKSESVIDGYIKNILKRSAERKRKDKRLTYYMVVSIGDSDRAEQEWKSVIRSLKEKYPHIVFLKKEKKG